MERLRTEYDGLTLYQAGLPKFPRVFTRDSIISALLSRDVDMLRDQLKFSALKQGNKKDPSNGEEPGKIFHEYPGYMKQNGLSTEFNACDTTALFLMGLEVYYKLTGDRKLINKLKKNIEDAIKYILSHLKDNLFIEDPKFCDADKFALKVTYWKDSVISNRENGEPKYPVIYTLAHIQNMRGLKSAAFLLNSKDLENQVKKMKEALKKLYDETGVFYIAKDRQGFIKGISSDILHALFYLDKEDLTEEQLNKIVEVVKILETDAGYRTLSPELENNLKDKYHANTIWPFEQAIINIGARKFSLKRVEEFSSRVLNYLDSDPEILILENGRIRKDGPDPQLWTIAAKKYFNDYPEDSII